MSLDIEHPENWTEKQSADFLKIWESAKPKITPKFGTVMFFGTAGEQDSSNLKDLFYEPVNNRES